MYQVVGEKRMLSAIQKEAILNAAIHHPEVGYRELAAQFRVGLSSVMGVVKKAGIKRQRGASSPAFRHGVAKNVKT